MGDHLFYVRVTVIWSVVRAFGTDDVQKRILPLFLSTIQRHLNAWNAVLTKFMSPGNHNRILYNRSIVFYMVGLQ